MPKYRIREGVRHGSRKQYGPGDIVEYTETEAAGFIDKLIRLPDEPAPVEVTPAPTEAIEEVAALPDKPVPVKKAKPARRED